MESLTFNILVTFSTVTFILFVGKFINSLPFCLRAVFKWKEAVQLEYSIHQSRDRNLACLVMFVPACLIFNSCLPWRPSFIPDLGDGARYAETALILIIYLLLRNVMRRLCKSRRTEQLGYMAGCNLFRSAVIILIPICLATIGVLTLESVPEATVTQVLVYEFALSFLLLLWREGEILKHYCTVLTTFLYLCGIEILPVLFLVTLWIV